MSKPTTLPLARLRAAGCRVSTLLGHDPITTGKSPAFKPVWKYGITLPTEGYGIELIERDGISEALRRWDNSWSADLGQAIAYRFRDGRIIVVAVANHHAHTTPEETRQWRLDAEKDVATLLGRIATIISRGEV